MKSKIYIVIFAIAILCVLIIFHYNQTNIISRSSPEEIIKCYITALNKGDTDLLYSVLSENWNNRTIYVGADKDKVILKNINTFKDAPVSQFTEGLYKTYIYEADIEIISNNGKEHIKWCFYIGKKGDNSPWLIYDIQERAT